MKENKQDSRTMVGYNWLLTIIDSVEHCYVFKFTLTEIFGNIDDLSKKKHWGNKGELKRSRFREGAPKGSGSPSPLLEPVVLL